MLLSFDPLQDRNGVEIVDHVERRQCVIETPTDVEPTEASIDDFQFPVDRGMSITTGSLRLPHSGPTLVRNSMGFLVEELTKGDSRDLPDDRYAIDLNPPVKLYFVVDSELSIDVSADEVAMDFAEPTEVLIGARSYHKHPADSITVTADPTDMMAGISALSSALKTTSPERSFPTHRGHPPTIELGDELDVPDQLERPDTGITIEVPRELRYVYVVSPLAYYLGAEVVPGPVPKLITETGFEHELDDPGRGFEGEVERVLKQSFFLDCLTRTEGFYPVNLHERNALEDALDLDFATLYDASLSEQLEAYLAVPYEVIEPKLPEWKLTTHVELTPEHVEVLPFVINDLAVVRSPSSQTFSEYEPHVAGVDEPIRAGDFTRSSANDGGTTVESAPVPSLIRPESADSLEQAWVGEGAPVGTSKAMIEAYRNRVDRTPTDGDIDITVVCNDAAMNDERDIVNDIYGSRDDLPFDLEIQWDTTVDELRAILEHDCDFLHYIGHIDERGFECSDGMLDATTLERTGVDVFFLNACTSYQQGQQLIRAGSVAGVVTLEDVINSGAERLGKTLAKLLNSGFPLRVALNIAKDQSIVGGHYLVLGDGSVDIAQSKSGNPALIQISDLESDAIIMDYFTFPTSDFALGSLTFPYLDNNDEYFLVSGSTGSFTLSSNEFTDYVSDEILPILFEKSLHWSDELETLPL